MTSFKVKMFLNPRLAKCQIEIRTSHQSSFRRIKRYSRFEKDNIYAYAWILHARLSGVFFSSYIFTTPFKTLLPLVGLDPSSNDDYATNISETEVWYRGNSYDTFHENSPVWHLPDLCVVNSGHGKWKCLINTMYESWNNIDLMPLQ